MNERFCKTLHETMYGGKLSNGLSCYIIPKKGFQEKFALLSVGYGSVDNKFTHNSISYHMPEGIAHFLEHKMFGDNDELSKTPAHSFFEQFGRLGASVNAYTNLTNTAYYFNCTENFYKCLALLIEMIQSPHFTERTVEKEKGVITSEIMMYADDPHWMAFLNLMGAMFSAYPVRDNIAGTLDSIARITPDMLYKCHDIFYTPDNMTLVCAGDISNERVLEAAGELKLGTASLRDKPHLTRDYGIEPEAVSTNRIEHGMPVADTLFSLGFKDNSFPGTAAAMKIAATNVVLDYAFGESSEFFERLYSMAVIDRPFSPEFLCGTFFGAALISSGGVNPDSAAAEALDELERIRANALDTGRFARIVKKRTGRLERGFNNISGIALSQADMRAKGIDLFDLADCYADIRHDDFYARLNELYNGKKSVLSIIKPKKGCK